MRELSFCELLSKVNKKETLAVFFYTPLCGTCTVASRMLNVVNQMLPDAPLYRANVNRMPQIAQEWKISSVPALLLIQNGTLTEKHYALHGVDHLYQLVKSLG